MKTKYSTILVLVLIIIALSAILTFSGSKEVCDINEGCGIVEASKYSSFMGIKLSLLGLIAFSGIGLIVYQHIKHPRKHKKKQIQIGIIAGSIIALYLLYLQFFVLNAICKYCFAIDITTLIILAILFLWKEK